MIKIIEWNKYIKWGNFTSKHGMELQYKWEFDKLNKEPVDREIILASILGLTYPFKLIGISTVNPFRLANKYCDSIYQPSRKSFSSKIDKEDFYVIYDDVVTTGRTILECLELAEIRPVKIICLIDRRKEVRTHLSKEEKDLQVISIERDILK